ncbi:hypothetical protein IQ268_21580 [Oculatella sp. LEGE 06141]|uniref:hypothetical protein n=1 Tax=Oculatella sp. LEGE 06141 TaxID=1828648 RepID=UPI0018823BF0|nr:hypothetical protein [Oculatella sp. LEGE 06141]
MGKPDRDGDPAVHYPLLTVANGQIAATIQRVNYDYPAWAETLEQEGVDRIFIEPSRTGDWTTGASSLPPQQRHQQPA